MEKLTWIWTRRQLVGATFMAALIAWTPVATLLSRSFRRPPPQSPWWRRALYDLFVDTPAWTATLGHSGIFGGLFNLPGIASRTPEQNPTPQMSRVLRARMTERSSTVHPRTGEFHRPPLILIGLLGWAIAAGGCTATFKACIVGKLPQTAETILVDVIGIAMSTASAVGDLEALFASNGIGYQDGVCIVQAIEAWYDGKKAKAKAEPTPQMAHARQLLAGYLAAHPTTACGPARRLAPVRMASWSSAGDTVDPLVIAPMLAELAP